MPKQSQKYMKQKFNVTGMHCASCAARVEKATNAVAGVVSANVNLLKESMLVEYEGDAQTLESVVSAIEDIGFGAKVVCEKPRVSARKHSKPANKADAEYKGAHKVNKSSRKHSKPANKADAERRSTQIRLIVSCVFTVPLFYLSMGHMFSWPLPACFTGHASVMTLALAEFILLLPVIFVNRKFFSVGFKTLAQGAPNMDSLVALGSTASTLYGITAMFRISASLGAGDTQTAHTAAMDLYFESAAMILTLITLGKYFEARAKAKTTKSVEGLLDLAPKMAHRIDETGEEAEVTTSELVAGDVLAIYAGERIPADGAVLEGAGSVDESAITGESVPVDKTVGAKVSAGNINTSGYFTMRAQKVGDDTTLAEIVRLVDEATSTKAPIQKIADKISGVFVPAVIAITVIVFIIWMIISAGDVPRALNYAISVLVISCPCALGLATPIAIMVGCGCGARLGILIKDAETLETAGKVKNVLLDKTGTITSGKPEVTDILEQDARLFDVAGAIEAKSEHPLARAVCEYVEARSDTRGLRKSQSGGNENAKAEYNTRDISVANFTQHAGMGLSAEIRFNENNRTNVRSATSNDTCVEILDNPCVKEDKEHADTYAKACAGNAKFMSECGITLPENTQKWIHAQSQLGATPLLFALDGKLLGGIAVSDAIKPTSPAAICALHTMGVSTTMITGDNEITAKAVAQKVGVKHTIAGVLPKDKDALVQKQRAAGACAMVGDGINDSPALARADVGIAIGAGSDIAIDCADVVLVNNDLLDVASCIQLSRATLRNIKQNLFWALIYNCICIPVAAGALSAVGFSLNPMIAAAAMSCSSLCVVGNALRLRAWKPSRDILDAKGTNKS